MLSVGELIWASSRPLIRLVLCVSAGFILTRLDRYPPAASRGTGQILLNIALPCLMFSRIIPAFEAHNVAALGTLLLLAVLYVTLGVIFAWIIKRFFWIPHRFRYGILVAGGWGNIGDIPTSVILSVTGSAPFKGIGDQNLAIAYMSVFVLVFMVTLFPCGAQRWVAMDFVGPDVEPEEVQEATQLRRSKIFWAVPRYVLRALGRQPSKPVDDDEKGDVLSKETSRNEARGKEIPPNDDFCDAAPSPLTHDTTQNKHVSFCLYDNPPLERSPFCSPTPTMVGFPQSPITSPTPSVIAIVEPTLRRAPSLLPSTCEKPSTSDYQLTIHETRHPKLSRFLYAFINAILTPQSFSIITSLVIAFVNPLKALFVPVPAPSSTHIHIHPAPDGGPPLAVILDTAAFIGAASVPLGLISLGAALARLSVPRNRWSSLPLGAISALAIAKMVLMPLIGVGIVRGFLKAGLISKEDKVLQFVCVFFACLPTSTIQVYLTQVNSGTGTAEHLPPFLIPQYVLMFFSMTGLVAYTLVYLF